MKKAGWVRLTSAEEKELQEKFNVHVGVQDVGVDWKKFKAWMREKGMRPNGIKGFELPDGHGYLIMK